MSKNYLTALVFLACVAAAESHAAPEITIPLGHGALVNAAAVSPDGKSALTGSDDTTVKLWDIASGRELRTLIGHSDRVLAVCYLPDGRRALSSSADRTLRLWDLETGETLHEETEAEPVRVIAVAPDGATALFGLYDRFIIWDVGTMRVRAYDVAGVPKGIHSAAFSRDGRSVLYEDEAGSVFVWRLGAYDPTMKARSQSDLFDRALFSADEKSVLSGGGDGTIKEWSAATGALIRTLPRRTRQESCPLALSPDGLAALSTDPDDSVAYWDLRSGEELKVFPKDPMNPIRSFAFLPDGKSAIFVYYGTLMRLMDLKTGQEIRTFGKERVLVKSVSVSADGKNVLSFTADTAIATWNVATGKMDVRSGKGYENIAFAPDGSSVLSSDKTGGALRFQGLRSGSQAQHSLDLGTGPNALAFSPDGRTALAGSASTGQLLLMDATTGKLVREIATGRRRIDTVTYLPDGARALTASFQEEGFTLWDLESGKALRSFTEKGVWSGAVAASPDGNYAITRGANYSLKLWDLRSGEQVRAFTGLRLLTYAIAFSPDGRRFAAGSEDGTIMLWELSDSKSSFSLKGHLGPVRSLAFSPDGRYLVSGAVDGTVRIWNPSSGLQIAASAANSDGEWIAWTPDSYFDGTPWAIRNLVHAVEGMSIYSVDQLFEAYYRPDIVASRIEKGEGFQPAAGVAKTRTRHIEAPPSVSIEVERIDGSYRGLAVQAKDTAAYRIIDGAVRIKAAAVDRGGGVDGLRLFHNGKIVGENLRGLEVVATGAGPAPGSSELTLLVSLVDGENRLSAVGFSADRTESSPCEVTITYSSPKAEKPVLWILAVGINQYRNPKYNLNFAVGDVDGFLESVMSPAERLFSRIQVVRVVDREAVKPAVVDAFRTIAGEAKSEDVFLFFYAGHGIALDGAKPGEGDFHFVLSDLTQMTSAEQVAKAGISGTEFRGLVSEIKAQKQFQVIDACNSGALSEAFARRGAAEEIALARLSRSTGSVLIAASQANQFAQEFASLGHGALTQALIEGFAGEAAGKDGQITVTRLKTWVEDAMPALTSKYSGSEQFPTGFAFGQDFPIGIK